MCESPSSGFTERANSASQDARGEEDTHLIYDSFSYELSEHLLPTFDENRSYVETMQAAEHRTQGKRCCGTFEFQNSYVLSNQCLNYSLSSTCRSTGRADKDQTFASSCEDSSLWRNVQTAIENNDVGISASGAAHGEERIVRSNGTCADEDSVMLRPHTMNKRARGGRRDPAVVPTGSGYHPVEGLCDLEVNKRSTNRSMSDEGPVQTLRLITQQSNMHCNSCRSKLADAAACHTGIRILHSRENLTNSRRDHRIHTGRSLSVIRAGLKVHVER